ncbi:MAG: FKBP-type peptidyl-prolyl cis-trans isomerase [Bacteroidales bacterium]|nr:FKBP-type peptidyl-prolyl cis-trans isomerase [Bacteroidales bacterium]
MRKLLFFIVLTVLVSGFSACRDRKPTGSVVSSSEEPKEDKDAPYVEGNKNIMRRENEEMQMFINRYGWQMQRTPTGLYIQILEPGTGDLFKENDPVTLKYRTFLLSGEQVYSSDSNGVKSFVVNRSEEIDALHEAAQMLRPGAKARLVISSHLGYGVAGDGDRIRGLQPFMMEISVLKDNEKVPETILPNPYKD